MPKLHKNLQYLNTKWTAEKVRQEIDCGLSLLNQIDKKIVTFFGSHLVTKKNAYYQHCQKIAYTLGQRNYAIMSGGGPGIMHAANSGATQATATSLGLQAELLEKEKITDKIFTHRLSFQFLFVRRFIMSIKSEVLIFYPGGFGTLNELFEFAMLMQTGIVDKVPIICVNKKYWRDLFIWLKTHAVKNKLLINSVKDMGLLRLVDEENDVINIIENR